MARVFIDGFEAGDLKLWDVVYGGAVIASGSLMNGVYCLSCNSTATLYAQKTLPAAAEYYLAFRYLGMSSNYSYCVCSFYNGATQLGKILRSPATGLLTFYRGTGAGTAIATGMIPVPLTATLIEVRYKPHDTAGVVQVKINGVFDPGLDFSAAPKDTTDGATTIDGIRFGGDGSNYPSCYFDNIVIDDAAWPGDTKIQIILVTGAGAVAAQWTPISTPASLNFECVNENPASETDYVQTNTTGHLDLYAAGNLVGSIESIKCVQVQALVVKEGAPTPLNLRLAINSGGTEYEGGDNAVPATTSKAFQKVWQIDPKTTGAWIPAGVNALEIGMKAVA